MQYYNETGKPEVGQGAPCGRTGEDECTDGKDCCSGHCANLNGFKGKLDQYVFGNTHASLLSYVSRKCIKGSVFLYPARLYVLQFTLKFIKGKRFLNSVFAKGFYDTCRYIDTFHSSTTTGGFHLVTTSHNKILYFKCELVSGSNFLLYSKLTLMHNKYNLISFDLQI